MERGIVCFSTDDLALSTPNLGLRMPHLGLRPLKLILQFGDFKIGQDFTLPNTITNIDLDPAYVSRDLGVESNLLVRLKLTCNREGAVEVSPCDCYNCC